jgi:predicted metal-binding membrane protein
LLLLASLVGWVAPLASGRWLAVADFCGGSAGIWLAGGWRGALALNQPELLVLPWLLMLLAMMPPLLVRPMRHLWRRSLRRRRTRAIALFAVAYTAVWLLAGVGLLAAAIVLRGIAEAAPGAAILPAVAIALLWQATPPKQACLNFCHRLPPLATFGLAADLDCLRFGLSAALWCVGTCWALMLVPLAADGAHLALMAVASVVMLAERLAPPQSARWRVPVLPWRLVARLMSGACRAMNAVVGPWVLARVGVRAATPQNAGPGR